MFINDSWAGLPGPNGETNQRFNPANPTSPFVCESDGNRAALGQQPAGCVQGMYCPVHCGPDPRSKFAVIYSMFPCIASGLIQNVVRNLKLNLCVADRGRSSHNRLPAALSRQMTKTGGVPATATDRDRFPKAAARRAQ